MNIHKSKFFNSLIIITLCLFWVSTISAQNKINILEVFLNSKNIFYFNKDILGRTSWVELANRYNLHPKQLSEFNLQDFGTNPIVQTKEVGIPLFFSVNLINTEIPIKGVTYLPVNYINPKTKPFSSYKANFSPEVYNIIKELNHLQDNSTIKKGETLFLGYFRINLQYAQSSFGKKTKRYNYSTPTSSQTTLPNSQKINQKTSTPIPSDVNIIGENDDESTFENDSDIPITKEGENMKNDYTPNENDNTENNITEIGVFKNDLLPNSEKEKITTCNFFVYEKLILEKKGRFFVLYDGCPIGQIVQLTNKINRKILYAKVANTLPNSLHKENSKKCILISRLAQEALQINEDDPLEIICKQSVQ